MNILLISPESWGNNYVSKHHYATVLANEGHQVFFLNPPIKGLPFIDIKKISYNLSSISYFYIPGLLRLPLFVINFYNKKLIRWILSHLPIKEFDIIWSFEPYQFSDLGVFGDDPIKIYHPVDAHHTRLEKYSVLSADHVFSVNRYLLEKLKVDKKGQWINHGLADSFIKQKFDIPKDFLAIRSNGQITVGMVGNLGNFLIDTELVIAIVSHYPDVNFVFIGPYQGSNLGPESDKNFIAQLKNNKNVYLLGSKHPTEIPNYINQVDILWIPYVVPDEPHNNPHKLLEYLSTGNPVVLTYNHEYRDRVDAAGLNMSLTNADYPALFAEVITHLSDYQSAELRTKRINYARENSYTAHIKHIFEIINKQ
jgi:hypothetical protein